MKQTLLLLIALSAGTCLSEEPAEIPLALKRTDDRAKEIRIQNSPTGNLEHRRFYAMQFFRERCQPGRESASWRTEIAELTWIQDEFVAEFPAIGTGFRPDDAKSLIVLRVLPEKDKPDTCRIYLGFDAAVESSQVADVPPTAKMSLDFLIKSRAKVVYLGLRHSDGFFENYKDGKVWFSFVPSILKKTQEQKD